MLGSPGVFEASGSLSGGGLYTCRYGLAAGLRDIDGDRYVKPAPWEFLFVFGGCLGPGIWKAIIRLDNGLLSMGISCGEQHSRMSSWPFLSLRKAVAIEKKLSITGGRIVVTLL